MKDFLYRLLMSMAGATYEEWQAYYAAHPRPGDQEGEAS